MDLKNTDSELLIKELLKRHEEKYAQKNWSNILINIIDNKAKTHIGPREFDTIGRTKTIKDICELLTKIQKTITFSEPYKIIYLKQQTKEEI